MNLRALTICLLSVFLFGFTSCQTTDTIILPEGPVATELGRAKDAQITGLVAQVKAEIDARALEQAQASLVAANLETILFASTYLIPGLPRNAVEEEAKLGKARSPAPNPEEIIKGKDRVIAILQNDVATAKAAYGKAFDEAAQARAQIAAKDVEITEKNTEIAAREIAIAKLTQDVVTEKAAHVADVKNALSKKDAEMVEYKAEQASAERRWWTNTTRIAGLALIVAGAIALAVFKLTGVGGGLVGAGVLVGLISIGVDLLTKAWWFPWLCGGVFIAVVGLGCWGIWQLWLKGALGEKKTQAIQDQIDEATILGDTKTVEELKAHLTYRLGNKTSFFGKAQAKEVAALGLVNPKGEEALKAASPSSPVP